jgi:hypothetical protein
MEQRVAAKRNKAWKIQWGGEDIVLRNVVMKIVHWVDKFKQIGDVIVQYDPGHAALPWAAFRFLLQVTFLTPPPQSEILISSGLRGQTGSDGCDSYRTREIEQPYQPMRCV